MNTSCAWSVGFSFTSWAPVDIQHTVCSKAKYGHFPPPICHWSLECSNAAPSALLCHVGAFLNYFGTFFYFNLIHLSTCSLRSFDCSTVSPSLSFLVFLSLSQLALSVSDTATVYEYRHRHSKDKRQHLLQREPWWLLDLGSNKRQEHSTINGCSELHLQRRWQSLSFCLALSHVQAHSRLFGKQGRQTLQWRRNACPVWAYMLSRAPNCSDKYEMVEMREGQVIFSTTVSTVCVPHECTVHIH